MKYLALLLLLTICIKLPAQVIDKNNLWKSWVLEKVTYEDGSELSEDNLMKYHYIKYTFSEPEKIQSSMEYFDKGDAFLFDLTNNELNIKTPQGWTSNSFRIDELSSDKMVLTQKADRKNITPESLKFYFSAEKVVQAAIKLGAADINSIINGDTIYNRSPKLYPSFADENFQRYIYSNIGQSMDGKAGRLSANFIVFKNGIADSVKIIEGISPKFDKAFIKAFTKASKKWTPAVLDGRTVSVMASVQLGYSTSAIELPLMGISDDALRYYNNRDFENARLLYDQILEHKPDDVNSLYMRGMCNLILGKKPAAIADWKRLKKTGSTKADIILAKYDR
ncbi:energy transducer TonB [Mucilaginibacter sp. ZT4R22]|uniref:Energy transducer TonB n=1 Tax=Mucilaginibacter pankratovii TaxID=2772110 RepID=A0ABR7WP64_9SPHI|nr:energy transducer TonB [Mucilaginibacter pankratovii]MBD1364110.1 energy transducer TonB [Mucilaginibacter pankratovii]